MNELSSNDRVPQVLKGEGANLDPFRHQASAASSFDQVLSTKHRVTPDECALTTNAVTVKATWQTENDDAFSNDNGRFYITTERILFVSTSDKNNDVAIDAGCIQLHAVSDDSVYIQIQQDDDDSTAIEFTVTPNENTTECCQVLFDALSKLVSMHPLDDDDVDDGLMDDAIFAPPADTGASEQERDAMLERLDNLLAVPPEYEVKEDAAPTVEGQFEDAEDEEEDDAIL